ncbi:Zinc finger matrin-type protein 3 [Frankliniella fusca]|uniref:Zinc finger matrin-type protein 3 n=1 Tax=Frankliniella fusca TaxID=407009 RepID=A0AAE1HR03_9NEOP|nr:Zinc finger matrin-type protein 3 [Frankliniella fusca]
MLSILHYNFAKFHFAVMNSYPIGVSELLRAPPPPPPPPVTDHGSNDKGAKLNTSSSIQLQTDGSPHTTPLRSNSSIMMIPRSHLSLLPPPPPPPPLPEVQKESSGCHRMTYPNNSGAPFPPAMRNANQKLPNHPYRAGPPPPMWALQRNTPSGLQGPWLTPSAERPVGVFEQLHPPGVPEENFAGGEQSEKNIEVAPVTAESSSGLEATVNSAGPKFSYAPTTYKDHKVNPKDPRLPRELTDLFEALHCKLCEVISSSNVQAQHHYSGKPHEKKVRLWLQKWSEETGLPLPKRPKVESSSVDINPEDLYCRVCDVAFTSAKHGEQHRMGKPHQKALKLGYSTSKLKKKVDIPFDPTGRFAIGEAFLKEVSNKTSEPVQVTNSDVSVGSFTPSVKAPPVNSKFYCELCQISTTSQEHLDAHYAGAKHRKALVNAARAGIKNDISVIPPPVEPTESILASVIGLSDGSAKSRNAVSSDLSIYRTPSGQFYCHPCNTTVNSEKSFKEHTESKRHKFKVASSKRS